ncbi:hypothetical protein HK100_009534 [Physocladia obscura]|uniref:Zn(2)-C6 fungal-type domain-containing protein n=1 Tax=Physocladia obscura TaxID=109957 RepID=A0AAD5SNK4_9FUNG|nr:hypothetical protein HK100_009534 [Physocladia obscura]
MHALTKTTIAHEPSHPESDTTVAAETLLQMLDGRLNGDRRLSFSSSSAESVVPSESNAANCLQRQRVPRPVPCELCRMTRKKCDQTKPGCVRCAELGVPCTYETTRKPYTRKALPKAPTADLSSDFPMLRQILPLSKPNALADNNECIVVPHQIAVESTTATKHTDSSLVRSPVTPFTTSRSPSISELAECCLLPNGPEVSLFFERRSMQISKSMVHTQKPEAPLIIFPKRPMPCGCCR